MIARRVRNSTIIIIAMNMLLLHLLCLFFDSSMILLTNAFQSPLLHHQHYNILHRQHHERQEQIIDNVPFFMTQRRMKLYSSNQYNSKETRRGSTNQDDSSTNNGVTSTLISNLAVVALKLRLASHTQVQCNVQSSSKQLLLQQSIGPVSVRGRDWSSPLGLTCKAIQADVNTCMLDMNSVLTKRKLILLEPAKGVALIAFCYEDFGNFLMHPLLQAQTPSLSPQTISSLSNVTKSDNEDERKFQFTKDNIRIEMDGNGNGNGQVTFYGKCLGQTWKCILKRGSTNNSNNTRNLAADIQVIYQGKINQNDRDLTEEDINSLEVELTMIVSNFFNELVFELDGTFLQFKDLKFHTPKKSSISTDRKGNNNNANIMFALDITVKKFPSPGLAF